MSISSAQNKFNLKSDHIAVLVADVDVAADFYANILTLREIGNAGLGDSFRWFELGNKVQIHLIESDEHIEKYKGVHFAISTDKLTEVMEHLKSNNIHFENWPGEAGAVNVRPDGVKQIYLKDPDGYWIEINDGGS